MRYATACSGLESATLAWAPLGWQAVSFSEIDPFCCAVLAHHFPDVPNLGDLTQHHAWADHGSIDVLAAGTPCQSFSHAGDRAGMADPRGSLALAFLDLVARKRPRWLVWENVPGILSSNGGRDLGAFFRKLGELGYGFAWRCLDAQHFGLAQRRERLFVVGHLGAWQPATAVLFERASLSGHPAPRRAAGQDATGSAPGSAAGRSVVGPLSASSGPRAHGFGDVLSAQAVAAGHILAFGGNNTAGPIDVATACLTQVSSGYRHDFESETFIASQSSAQGQQVRRLTPTEWERLQGLPDAFTLVPYRGRPAPDGPRYRAIGNAWPVPVARWIGERLQAVQAVLDAFGLDYKYFAEYSDPSEGVKTGGFPCENELSEQVDRISLVGQSTPVQLRLADT